jgi:hypothetical protein
MKNFLFSFLIIFNLFLFYGCEENDNNDDSNTSNTSETTAEPTKNSEFWGEWKELKTQDLIYITSQTNLSIEKLEDGLIQINNKYYLRSGTRNVNLNGSIESTIEKTTQNFNNIGSIDLILENLKDANIRAELNISNNGSFSDNSLPTGDYSLIAQNNDQIVEANISLTQESENLGNFKLMSKDKANFQIEFDSDVSNFFADGTKYSANIIVKNIGYGLGAGLFYEISLDGVKSFESSPSIGTILSKQSKNIPVSFSFEEQFENIKNYILNIKITDANSVTWERETQIAVHKGTFDFNFKTEKNIEGVIKYPNGNILNLSFNDTENIKLPLIAPNNFYTLILTNYGNIDSETIYSVALNSDVQSFDGFFNTPAFEPNNQLENAHILNLLDSEIAYLHYNDIDYFKIRTEEDLSKTFEEIDNKSPTANFTISWNGEIPIFDASLSSDPNNNITEYIFESSIDGEFYRGSESSFEATNITQDREHNITLTVIDKFGLTSSISKNINTINEEPVAVLKLDEKYFESDTINLDGSSSSDDKSISEYIFTSSKDGELYRGSESSFKTKLSIGTHEITLKVTDSQNIQTEIVKTVIVEEDPNIKPIAIIQEIEDSYFSGDEITLDGSLSSDSDGNIVSYLWSSDINGTLGTNEVIQISTLSEGNHTITLTITDNDGAIATENIRVEIEKQPFRFLNIPQSFTRDNINDVVIDEVSSLKWEDTEHVKNTTLNYIDAKSYCENLTLGEITDWRVPTVKELWYLHDRSKSNPALNSTFQNYKYFNASYGIYAGSTLTSTVYSQDNSQVWVIQNNSGASVRQTEKTSDSSMYVRCVSGVSDYENLEFEKNFDDNVVIDKIHNLMWQDENKTYDAIEYSKAQNYCYDLSLNGYSNWRLPSIQELFSITNHSFDSPALNKNFRNISGFIFFWSKTKWVDINGRYWIIMFNEGDSYVSQSDVLSVRCVRDMK